METTNKTIQIVEQRQRVDFDQREFNAFLLGMGLMFIIVVCIGLAFRGR